MRWVLARFRGESDDVQPVVPVRLIVGLGNPGPKYANTRHNIGFRIVEALGARAHAAWRMDQALDARVASLEIAGHVCLLVQPQTFMNQSGRTVLAALERWPDLDPQRDLLIAFDDMDLPTGRLRLRPSGGGGGHNGIGDVLSELDTKGVPRLRFGVGHPGRGAAVLDWVLSAFDAEEEEEVLKAAVERSADAVEAFVAEGISAAMGQYNAQS